MAPPSSGRSLDRGLRRASRSRSSSSLAQLSSNRGHVPLHSKHLLEDEDPEEGGHKVHQEDGPPHTRSWPGLMLCLLAVGCMTALYFFLFRRCARGHWPSTCHALHLDRGYYWVSIYKAFEQRDEFQCNQLLGFPRVALLFQSAGGLHHEELWRAWFENVAGLIPLAPDGTQGAHLRLWSSQHPAYETRRGCEEATLLGIQLACLIRPTDSVIERQHLFTVYAHPSKSYEGFDRKSVFYGHVIRERVDTAGDPGLRVDASRLLLRAALEVRHNQQFLLLSEDCVPLYPGQVVWQQLASEPRSRVNACKGKHVDHYYWPRFMPNNTLLKREHWRKSPQWFGLRREAAELVARDTDLLPVMRQYCIAHRMVDGRWYACFVDEHYIPSLLVFRERGGPDYTDCHGGLTAANWSVPNTPHPVSYRPADINPEMLDGLRNDVYFSLKPLQKEGDSHYCWSNRAIKTARQGFIQPKDLYAKSCSPAFNWSPQMLSSQCPLFARKFGNDTAEPLFRMMRRCGDNKLHITAQQCS